MRRIFIGVRISDEAKTAAANHILRLRGEFPRLRIGWERPEKLHLTLKFLGDTDEEAIPAISESLGKVASDFKPFEIAIGSGGVFPGPRKPRVLWLGVDDAVRGLSALHESVEDALSGIGFARETRPFSPHLTIARVREPESGAVLAQRHLAVAPAGVNSTVSAVTLFESVLRPGGSVYGIIGEFGLKGRD